MKKKKQKTQIDLYKKVRKVPLPLNKVIKSKRDKLRDVSSRLMNDFMDTYENL